MTYVVKLTLLHIWTALIASALVSLGLSYLVRDFYWQPLCLIIVGIINIAAAVVLFQNYGWRVWSTIALLISLAITQTWIFLAIFALIAWSIHGFAP
jgi:hypothetical protein